MMNVFGYQCDVCGEWFWSACMEHGMECPKCKEGELMYDGMYSIVNPNKKEKK